MLHLSISLRALVFVLLLGMVTFAGSDVAHSAPSLAELTGDGLLMNNPGQNGARDVHTDSTNSGGDNLGGVRIYAGNTLTNPPTTAALQFYGNGHTLFAGQAYIDSGSTAGAAIIGETTFTAGVGVTGKSTSGRGVVGISGTATGVYGETTSGYAGYFLGNTVITGQIQDAGGVCYEHCPSDARLKKDVTPLNPVLASLSNLQPVTFSWRVDEFPEMHFSSDPTVELIAQDVEGVLPELVYEGQWGYKGVRYEQLPVLLLEGVKELKAENDALREQLTAKDDQLATVEARLAAIERLLSGGATLVAVR